MQSISISSSLHKAFRDSLPWYLGTTFNTERLIRTSNVRVNISFNSNFLYIIFFK